MSRNSQSINGVLNINKPPGLTSHDVVAHIRRLLPVTSYQLPVTKVGHAGTLDPFATGVLLVLIGSATRLAEYVNMLPKTYATQLTLGATSDTDDLTGKISKPKKRAGKTGAGKTPSSAKPACRTGRASEGRPGILSPGIAGACPTKPERRSGVEEAPVEEARVKETLASFAGPQQQTPPPYSAVKIKGQPAYKAARRGSPLKLAPRNITIHSVQLIDYQYPILSIKVTCGSGTYIRALARDIGSRLDTGAYVSKLRRTSIGPPLTKPKNYMKPISGQKFNLKNAIRLNQLTADNLLSRLLPPSTLVAHLPLIILTPPNVAQLKKGQPIEWGTASPVKQPLALFTKNNSLVGIGRFDLSTKLLSPDKIL